MSTRAASMFDRMIHALSTFRPKGAAQRDHALTDF